MATQEMFKEKNIIITGGSSGIGRCASEVFALMGAHVTLVARREDQLQQAVAEIRSKLSFSQKKIDYTVLDVSDNESVKTWSKTYWKEHGSPDVIINSAGIAASGYFEEMDMDVFHQQIAVNLYGTIHMCSAFIPMMKASGGYIVNIASVGGLHGVFGYSAYCSAKFSVVGFSQSLRSEMKRHNIHVSALCPPSVDTPMLKTIKHAPQETQAVEASGGVLPPETVVKAMIQGMQSKRFLIVPGMLVKIQYWLDRYFPRIIEWYLDWIVRNAQKP